MINSSVRPWNIALQSVLLWAFCSSLGRAQETLRSPEERISQIWMAEPGDNSLEHWSPRELFEDQGVVLEWNQQKLTLVRPNAKTTTTIIGDQVVRIEPAWANESAEKLHRMYCDRQFAAVLANGRAVIASKLPLWEKLLILSEMIESASSTGKTVVAATLFSSLAKENSPELLLATIPVSWGDEVLADDQIKLQGLAENWINEEHEALQLLGASWLLSGSKRSIAVQKLELLAKSSKIRIISAYAKAQLWRTVPPAEIMSDRYPQWTSQRDALPLPLQAGPSMLLAERLNQAGKPTLAIAEWLRIATLHADRYHLATKAKKKAIQALKQLGRNDEAEQVEKSILP